MIIRIKLKLKVNLLGNMLSFHHNKKVLLIQYLASYQRFKNIKS